MINSISGGPESATVTLRVDSFGVLVASDFTFVVSVFSPSDTTNPVAVMMITPDSIDSPIVTIVVESLSEGTYLFAVTSQNMFNPPLFPYPLSSQVLVQQSQGNSYLNLCIFAIPYTAKKEQILHAIIFLT